MQPAKPLIWLGQEPYGHRTDHWLPYKLIGLYGFEAADPTILQPSRKDLYRICSYTMCHYVIKIQTLTTEHFSTQLVRAKEETQPHRCRELRQLQKLLLKMAVFPSLQHFPCSKPIYIKFSKTPGFGFKMRKNLAPQKVKELSSSHLSALKDEKIQSLKYMYIFLVLSLFSKVSIKKRKKTKPPTSNL